MDCLFSKPKFPEKCKSLIKRTKQQLEIVRKKDSQLCEHLKYGINDLLTDGSDDVVAFRRAGWLLVESSRLSVYDSIEQFLDCIENHAPLFQKQQSQCPEECREAVSSLIYAADRVCGMPGLRKLRSLFTKRYGISIASSPQREFTEKFKPEPPSKDVKLQLLHDIAQEFSVKWDSKAFEQRLSNPPPINGGEAKNRGRQGKHANSASVVPAMRIVPSDEADATSSRTHATRGRSDAGANPCQAGKLPKHVHPKLPDYDALVAYFTTIKKETMKGYSEY